MPDSNRNRGGIRSSELVLTEGVETVSVPFGGGNDYVCPNCEKTLRPTATYFLSKPPKYRNLLNDVIRCSECSFIFSPRSEAHVLRQ